MRLLICLFAFLLLLVMLMGCGATSRIAFWLWYTIPASALLLASPELGAIIYGTYGTARGMAVWAIILGLARWLRQDFSDWLIRHGDIARIVAATQLVLLGVAVVIAIGL